jgi:phage-related tail protein
MNSPEPNNEIKMDVNNLYREETFTDNAVGTLRRMTPVTAEGETDAGRPVQFIGSTQILTTAGPLPLSFEIEATTLTEAAAAFGDAAKDAFEKTMEELKEMQRQQASSIVVPKGGVDPMGGGMGGGKIQMP